MAKSTDIRLLLVRTGATEWEAAGRLCGTCDLPLSAEGRQDVKESVTGVVGEAVSLVLCGPDEASVATAKALAERIGAKVRELDDLAEVGLGLWEGMLASEVEEKYPTSYRQWKDDPASVTPPEGESLAEAEERIIGALSRGLAKAKGATGVVLRPMAHALVRGTLLKVPASRLWAMMDESAAVEWHSARRDELKAGGERARAES
ncbi:MAG TPA: histidine phosphatase family protein [Phycisphaerales bacterium]|nr:histidine phosphatase family protein [Phycisphaerales bacterium]